MAEQEKERPFSSGASVDRFWPVPVSHQTRADERYRC
jgi:hypothetical protein